MEAFDLVDFDDHKLAKRAEGGDDVDREGPRGETGVLYELLNAIDDQEDSVLFRDPSLRQHRDRRQHQDQHLTDLREESTGGDTKDGDLDRDVSVGQGRPKGVVKELFEGGSR